MSKCRYICYSLRLRSKGNVDKTIVGIRGIAHFFTCWLECDFRGSSDCFTFGVCRIPAADVGCSETHIILRPGVDRRVPIMPQRWNHFLSQEDFLTFAAMLSLSQAGFFTGRRHCGVRYRLLMDNHECIEVMRFRPKMCIGITYWDGNAR